MRFSQPLVPGAADQGNWTGRHLNLSWTAGLAVAIAPDKILLDIIPGAPNIGPDVVSYSPPPYDVRSTPGLVPAAAFADYPIT